jgi:hypothetical protein
MRNASSGPFLYEMSALLQAIDNPSGWRIDNFVDRQIASFIPTGVAGWQGKSDGTERTLIQEERERISGTRFGGVARMRRKPESVASDE